MKPEPGSGDLGRHPVLASLSGGGGWRDVLFIGQLPFSSVCSLKVSEDEITCTLYKLYSGFVFGSRMPYLRGISGLRNSEGVLGGGWKGPIHTRPLPRYL